MVSYEELKAIFEALLPDGLTNLSNGPSRFEQFGSIPKETALELCEEWKLSDDQKLDFWYVWENHPTQLARSPKTSGKLFHPRVYSHVVYTSKK